MRISAAKHLSWQLIKDNLLFPYNKPIVFTEFNYLIVTIDKLILFYFELAVLVVRIELFYVVLQSRKFIF